MTTAEARCRAVENPLTVSSNMTALLTSLPPKSPGLAGMVRNLACLLALAFAMVIATGVGMTSIAMGATTTISCPDMQLANNSDRSVAVPVYADLNAGTCVASATTVSYDSGFALQMCTPRARRWRARNSGSCLAW